jgi:hypothetical protein
MCPQGTYHRDLAEYKRYHNIVSWNGSVPVGPIPPAPPMPTAPTQSGAVAQSGLPGNVGKVINGTWFITERQFYHLKDNLGQDELVIQWWTKNYASTRIAALHAEEKKRKSQVSGPTGTKIPIQMLHDLKDGYYAARQSAEDDWNFFMVSRPKSNKYRGTIKIQTQHGPNYKLALVVWPNDAVTLYQPRIENDLLLVSVDPNGCGIQYAEIIGRCMRCNLDLTDPRSRWYGIGPDCEKVWPHIIDIVNDRKGVFTHGS